MNKEKVTSVVELTAATLRGAMKQSLVAAGSPSFHEEGGFWERERMNQRTAPGADGDPSKDGYTMQTAHDGLPQRNKTVIYTKVVVRLLHLVLA